MKSNEIIDMIRSCGDDYVKTIDLLVSSKCSNKTILSACISYNSEAFKYFFEKYMCYTCIKDNEKYILDILSSKYDNNCELLEYIFSKGIYPDQVCRVRYHSCECKHQGIPCHTIEECKCVYHCSDTSFFNAIWRDCHYDFLRIGLKYIDPNIDSVLFKNRKINKVLLSRYIKFIKGSDDERHGYRTLILLYEFYKKNCDSTILYENFINMRFDECNNCTCTCTRNCKCQVLEKIKKLEQDILQLKQSI